MKLLIARHGNSKKEVNLRGFNQLLGGCHAYDKELTDEGIEQAEQLAELFFTSANGSVALENHALVFSDSSYYYNQYAHIIEDWTNFLLYKRWCILILLAVWLTSVNWKKKLRFSLIFLLVHQFAIAGDCICLESCYQNYIVPLPTPTYLLL